MSWWQWLPAVLAAAAVLLLPGLCVGLSAGLRRWALAGFAAPLSVTLVAVAAQAAAAVQAPWAVPVLVATTAVASGLLLALRSVPRLTARRPAARHVAPREPVSARRPRRRTRPVYVAGPVLAALLTAALLGWAFGRPDAISQTYDAVFHLNAVRWVVESGNATPRSVSAVAREGGSFYPAAWHGVTSLVVPAAGGSVPAAANAVAVAVAAALWPLSIATLTRQVLGPGAAPAVAATLAPAFVGFPWLLLDWGVLWPQALGTTLAAPALAAGVSLLGAARRDVVPRRPVAALLLVASSLAAASAHPGSFLGVALLGLAATVWRLGGAAGAAVRARRPLVALPLLAGALAAPAVAYRVAAGAAVLASVRRFDWPATDTPWGAVRQLLLLAPDDAPWALALGLLVVVGAVRLLADGRAGWVVLGYAVLGVLDVLATSSDSELSQALTGFWFNDRHRILSMLPLVGVPLAAAGTVAIARWARAPVLRDRRRGFAVAMALAVTAQGAATGARQVAGSYRLAEVDDVAQLVDEPEQRFYARLADLVGSRDVVASSPWTGGALAYAISGRPVLFPGFRSPRSQDLMLLASGLKNIAADPAVCRAAEQRNVSYALEDVRTFSPPPHVAGGFEGLRGLAGTPGLVLVAREGPVSLYRVLECRR